MNIIEESKIHPSQALNGAARSRIRGLQAVPGEGVRIVELPAREILPFEVEVAPIYSFISAGTELSMLRTHGRDASRDLEPIRMGYSQCGVIKAVGASVKGLCVGQRVAAIGNGAFHATRCYIAQNLVAPLPDGVDSKAAALAAMFCFALEGAKKSKVRFGENVVVFGGGMMGQFSVRLYQSLGARVCCVDANVHRLKFLPPGTAMFSLDDAGWGKLAEWAQPYGVEHASICFGGDATAVIEKLKGLMPHAPDGVPHGRIVFPGGARISLLMASNMGNIELVSSAKAGPGYRDPVYESGMDYPATYVSHHVRRNLWTMLQMLKDTRLELESLITNIFPFSQAEAAYDTLLKPNVEALAVLLDYQGETDTSW